MIDGVGQCLWLFTVVGARGALLQLWVPLLLIKGKPCIVATSALMLNCSGLLSQRIRSGRDSALVNRIRALLPVMLYRSPLF